MPLKVAYQSQLKAAFSLPKIENKRHTAVEIDILKRRFKREKTKL